MRTYSAATIYRQGRHTYPGFSCGFDRHGLAKAPPRDLRRYAYAALLVVLTIAAAQPCVAALLGI